MSHFASPEFANALAFRIHIASLQFAPIGSQSSLPQMLAESHFFHIRREARDHYGFDDTLFGIRGDIVFINTRQSQEFVATYNAKNGLIGSAALRASELHAMGTIHEVFHALIALYRQHVGKDPFRKLIENLRDELGSALQDTLSTFVETFPPPSVYRKKETAKQFLTGFTGGISNEEWILEELILVWVSNQNPGYHPILSLIDDTELRQKTSYEKVVARAQAFFRDQPTFGPDKQSLIDLLLAPMRHSPNALSSQLEFMRSRWGVSFSNYDFFRRILLGIDVLTEEGEWFRRKAENEAGHVAGAAGFEPGGPREFKGELYEAEPERFSTDLAWMPRVVMIAKSTFVWLAQLSKSYGRPIEHLDQIPNEELDTLAARGFTSLWLIGLWRRSVASERIKKLSGKEDAVASAYSLYDYEIASELGGHTAYEKLKDRAWSRGIRLASDMVPNHMGVDSSWVVRHPDWFIQSDYPPFPSYTFDGPDLSEDSRVGIFLEDGYWNRTDAAVVFKRLDRHTGDVKYIYHGNDGTSMPWNDTAQLNYLNSQVREAVIQTILHVARLFPIIRFDAAMTLAKRHYQRLWFPLPGHGGAIPSRAEHGLSKEQFDSVFPEEFWREVVDRVAAEVPDTLLLAEAFWMMEGYFVRTLGMHRVYNSAFMHMLKKEDNTAFRTTIKNVLEYNPQILKRHVNFMNNPDEETAALQFGKDDRYFGVAILMSTMPGLPMFGHGQIEGFSEKYGMEFKRPRFDEVPDSGLISRHEREIFPLLKKRYLFSEVDAFLLYDFFTEGGHVDEDVFAHSNRNGDERALIIFHNKYKETRGWIRASVGFLEGPHIVQKTLAEGLALTAESPSSFIVFKDASTGLEYVRRTKRLQDEGFYIELGAFKTHVFWEFKTVYSSAETPYSELADQLGDRGVPSLHEALVDLHLKPVHAPFYEAICKGSIDYLRNGWDGANARIKPEAELALVEKLENIFAGLAWMKGPSVKTSELVTATKKRFSAVLAACGPKSADEKLLSSFRLACVWIFTDALTSALASLDASETPASVEEHWHLQRIISRALRDAGVTEEEAVGSPGTELEFAL